MGRILYEKGGSTKERFVEFLQNIIFQKYKNQSVYIPIGVLHPMENIGDELVEFVETQIGNYLGEDDIVRYQDDFGRV